MQVLKNSSWTRVPALFAVVAILSGAWTSPAAMAQEETAVEDFPTVLQRDITLWSDGTRLSGVLLYPKDREEGEKLSAIVLCNGWGGTKAFLMRSGIAPRFAAAGYVVINYDYRGWGDTCHPGVSPPRAAARCLLGRRIPLARIAVACPTGKRKGTLAYWSEGGGTARPSLCD